VIDVKNITRRRLWSLKVQRETTFAKRYPETAENAKKYWEEQERNMEQLFKKSELPLLDQFFSEVFAKYGVLQLTKLRELFTTYKKQSKFKSLNSVTNAQFLEKLKAIADQLHTAYYLRIHPNESWNKYRDLILSVFKNSSSPAISTRDVKAAAKKELDAPIPEPIYVAIMKELAYTSNGKWIFRTGNLKD